MTAQDNTVLLSKLSSLDSDKSLTQTGKHFDSHSLQMRGIQRTSVGGRSVGIHVHNLGLLLTGFSHEHCYSETKHKITNKKEKVIATEKK